MRRNVINWQHGLVNHFCELQMQTCGYWGLKNYSNYGQGKYAKTDFSN